MKFGVYFPFSIKISLDEDKMFQFDFYPSNIELDRVLIYTPNQNDIQIKQFFCES